LKGRSRSEGLDREGDAKAGTFPQEPRSNVVLELSV